MTDIEGSRSLVRRGLGRVQGGNRAEGIADLRAAVAVADRDEDPQDQIASRLVLADVLGVGEARALLDDAYAIAVDADDVFGIASVSAQIGMIASEPVEGETYLRRAAAGFRAAGRQDALAGVLVSMVGVLPDDEGALEALSELRGLEGLADAELRVLGATGSIRWAERLLGSDQAAAALPVLIDAHDTFVAAHDGRGAIAAGLRLNAALSVLHDAWARFPDGERLAERFDIPAGEMGGPEGGSEVTVGWNFDPRNLPITARHFTPFGTRNGWVLWSGDEPTELSGYLYETVDEVLRWLPQVRPYLELPPGWAFQIAPDHEDVWEEPELVDD